MNEITSKKRSSGLLRLASLVVAAAAITACSNDSSESAAAPSAPAAPANTYSFDYSADGSASVGTPETISLNIGESFASGVMSVVVKGPSELEFSSLTSQSFALDGTDSVSMDIDFVATAAGTHSVEVITYTDDGNGNLDKQSRSIDVTASL